MLKLYAGIMTAGRPVLHRALLRRSHAGKEDMARLNERMGVYEKQRPDGALVWLHAASVGEAQSALILIQMLKERTPCQNVLVTTGTVTSARLMEKRLPQGAFHQFCPVDRPQWVRGFLDHWKPDAAIWMESELWPSMLTEIRRRNIPAALINARLSPKSSRRWRFARKDIGYLLNTFALIMTQTAEDAVSFRNLGARHVVISGNLKYSAAPLPADEKSLSAVRSAIGNRPLWLYASTHEGEEEIACRIHRGLKKKIPNLLTVIAPRHPDRRERLVTLPANYGLTGRLRGTAGLPQYSDDIYIADTMGELGLFYRLAPMACIGRSLSNDGGGGHNPIEAAQLGCAVLHGPHVQNLAAIYAEMDAAGASRLVKDEEDLQIQLERMLTDVHDLETQQRKGALFVRDKEKTAAQVADMAFPLLFPTAGNHKTCT